MDCMVSLDCMVTAAPRRWTRRDLPYADALNALRPGRASDYASLPIPRWVLGTADAERAVVSRRCCLLPMNGIHSQGYRP
jgi:hypothetical protein